MAERQSRFSRSSPSFQKSRGSSLGLRIGETLEVIKTIDHGFPYESIHAFQRSTDLPLDVIASLIRIPSRTLDRRRQQGKLQSDESERLLRLSTLFEKAVDLFDGNRPAAMTWLQSPLPALGGNKPLELARTEIGAREVEDLIGRLEHGVFS